jgi:hypothetical protein
MKLISFSLYGNEDKYIKGMDANIELQKEHYPGWKIIIFHDDSVDKNKLQQYKNKGVILRNVEGIGIFAASWRFLVFDEKCDRFIVRDADSRISQREVEAVKEWERENALIHIMRDHPHHGYSIMGGMWGLKPEPVKRIWGNVTMADKIIEHQRGKQASGTDRKNWWMKDQNFLRDVIYLNLVTKNNSTIHTAQDFPHPTTWNCEHWSKDFPTPIGQDKRFVGEIYTFNGDEEVREYQYRER